MYIYCIRNYNYMCFVDIFTKFFLGGFFLERYNRVKTGPTVLLYNIYFIQIHSIISFQQNIILLQIQDYKESKSKFGYIINLLIEQ